MLRKKFIKTRERGKEMAYGIMFGTVVGRAMKNPENGKPHVALHVLQPEQGEDAEPKLEKVKVLDLNAELPKVGEEYKAVCVFDNWSFDGKTGLSIRHIKNLNGKK